MSVYMYIPIQVVIFVYDITNYSSFENLDDWLAIIERECFKDDAKPPHLALVANKSESRSISALYILTA